MRQGPAGGRAVTLMRAGIQILFYPGPDMVHPVRRWQKREALLIIARSCSLASIMRRVAASFISASRLRSGSAQSRFNLGLNRCGMALLLRRKHIVRHQTHASLRISNLAYTYT